MIDAHYHEPVLLTEVLDFLITDATNVYVDATVGGGGHAEGICRRLLGNGHLICVDADEDAIRYSSGRLRQFGGRVTWIHANFRYLRSELQRRNIHSIAGLLLDLGVSSFQLDEAAKGFSFRADERLDMRMDRRNTLTAWEVVNTYDGKRLAEVLWKYGDERHSRRIAKAIVAARPMDTTGQLRDVLESTVGKRYLIKTSARVFQAIRIEVNAELQNLGHVLHDCVKLVTPGGRIVVLSYHSLEDRIVKQFFNSESAVRRRSGDVYGSDAVLKPRLKVLTKKPMTASKSEIALNPRARSAKMRVAERVAE